jgi:hypothetical protein
MKHSKIQHCLQVISSDEAKKLSALIKTAYLKASKDCQKLILYFLSEKGKLQLGEGLSKEETWALLFPNQVFSDKEWRYLSSEVVKTIESFWAIEKFLHTAMLPELLLHEVLIEKKLDKNFQAVNRRLEARFDHSHAKDIAYHRARLHWLNTNERAFLLSQQRRFDLTLQHCSEGLDIYYFLQKLQYACAMLDRQAILQGQYDPRISEHWLEHLKEQDFFNEPLIKLYYVILLALQEEQNEAHFQTMRHALLDQQVQGDTLKDVYFLAINYCARKIRQGHETYVLEALNFYRQGLDCGALLENKEISPWTFTNVVKLSLRLRQFDEIELFFEAYADRLSLQSRANALAFNRAELFYYTGRIEEAQLLLNQVSYSDLNYYLGARVLLAKLYYETAAEKALLSLLASFTIFLKRNQEISGAIKQTYLNFCELLFQIIRCKPQQIGVLHEKISTTTLLSDRTWLLAILEQK